MKIKLPYRKLTKLAGSPFVISALLAIPIFVIVLPTTSRYTLNLEQQIARAHGSYSFLFDLNNDGQHERVFTKNNELDYTPLLVEHVDGLVQINLKGKFAPSGQAIRAIDVNSDGSNELIVLSATDDSVYLSCYNPLKRSEFLLNLPIAAIGSFSYESHPYICILDCNNRNNRGVKEIVVTINVGFQKYPRRVFAIDPISGNIRTSPDFPQVFQVRSSLDLTDDGLNDYILQTMATGNYDDSVPYSDKLLYLIVLNNSLDFLFEPVLMGQHPATLSAEPVNDSILFLMRISYAKSYSSALKLFNINSLTVIDSLIDNEAFRGAFLIPNSGQGNEKFLVYKDGIISFYNSQLQMFKQRHIDELQGEITEWHRADLSGDGNLEIIAYSENTNQFIVADQEFNHNNLFLCDIGRILYPPIILSSKDGKSRFLIVGSTHDYHFTYAKNPKYWLQFTGLPFIYLFLVLVLTMIYRWQKKRILLRLEEQNRIEQMQFSLAMNQFDSHFTLNIMSVVASLYESHNKTKADLFLSKYLKHLRNSLVHSNESLIAINDELEYVKNYLALESGRLLQGMEYHIHLPKSINSNTLIPRNLIYTFIENAVKHGIAQKPEQKGVVIVKLTGQSNDMVVIVQDNGVGRKAAKKTPVTSTGMGLKIINEIIDFHERYSDIFIKYSYEDLFDERDSSIGTKVIIHIKRAKTWKWSQQ